MRVRDLPALCLITAHLLTACATRPIVKIGLVAPFEGRYRDVGYEVIYAVRLAVREVNRAGGVGGYGVELVAFDDGGDASSAGRQARKVAADPLVVGVLGHFLDATTLAAAPEYAHNGIVFLATTSSGDLPAGVLRLYPTDEAFTAVSRERSASGDTSSASGDAAASRERSASGDAAYCGYPCGALDELDWLIAAREADPLATVFGPPLWQQTQFAALAGAAAEGVYVLAPAPLPADIAGGEAFEAAYEAISGGVEPKSLAVLAYDATRFLFAAIERDIGAHERPSRAGVRQAVSRTVFAGLSGEMRFEAGGGRPDAPVWVYRWEDGKLVRP